MSEILNWIMESIRAHGAWSVFIGVIIESVIVPIPSPLIIMGAGFVLISPELSFVQALLPIALQIVLPGSIASTLGGYIGYAIGYFGGKALVDRWEKFLGFSWQDVEALERRFQSGQVNTLDFFSPRAADFSPVRDLGCGGFTALAPRPVQSVDFLRHHPALSFSWLSRLGTRRNLSRHRQRHRQSGRHRLGNSYSRHHRRDHLAARPRAGQIIGQSLDQSKLGANFPGQEDPESHAG